MSKSLMNALRTFLGSDCSDIAMERGEIEILVPSSCIVEALQKLKTDDTTEMNQLVDLCAVDYPESAKRFEVIYQLLSLKNNIRLRIVVEVARDETLSSVTGVYPSAGWFEREAFDLFGIVFDGHSDLRRILTDYDFEGHPLLRDFPLSGHTQVRYDDLERRVVKEPVQLEDPYREFNTKSRWQGVTDVQKRGQG